MATLSSYLSSPRKTSVGTTVRYPTVRSPYSGVPAQNQRARADIGGSLSQPDLGTALLQQQQFAKASAPSTQFQQDPSSYDPILNQIQALGTQSVANARTNANQLRNRAAILTGDPQLLQSLGFDQNTIAAASNNPESLFATLSNDYSKRQRDLAEYEQSQNLYYSGEYQRQLGDLAKGFASSQASIGQRLRDLLSGADTGVLDSEEAARQADLQAAQQAAMQASYSDSLSGYQSQIGNLLDQISALSGRLNTPQGGNTTVPSNYTDSYHPGTIYQDSSGSPVSIQPSGYVAPAYEGPVSTGGSLADALTGNDQYVSPLTYAGAGAPPQPISSGMVSAPNLTPFEVLPQLPQITLPEALAQAANPVIRRGGGPNARLE